jgi:hypothetical protein
MELLQWIHLHHLGISSVGTLMILESKFWRFATLKAGFHNFCFLIT